jgi:hypothetical protein
VRTAEAFSGFNREPLPHGRGESNAACVLPLFDDCYSAGQHIELYAEQIQDLLVVLQLAPLDQFESGTRELRASYMVFQQTTRTTRSRS